MLHHCHHHLFFFLLLLFLPSTTLGDQWHSPEALSFLAGSNPSFSPTILDESKDCITEIRSSSSAANQRFTDLQLAVLCRNRRMWTSQSLQRSGDGGAAAWSAPFRSLTSNQQRFLDHFHNCKTVETCVCGVGTSVESCRTMDARQQIDVLQVAATPVPVVVAHKQRRQASETTIGLPRALRKEYRMLTDEERNRFHDAINRLKADRLDNVSKYDLLVVDHTPQESPGAHWGPAFLPWHREFLKQLETALRTYDRSVSIPYWDSTLDEGLPDPRDSILWTEQFMGSGVGGVITSGPFKHWQTYHEFDGKRQIVRDAGRSPFGALYRQSDFDTIMSKATFGDLTNCVDPFFELLHGTIHLWVGGHMLDVPISPNDPVFFLHHSFVDYMWEKFRQQRQSTDQQRDTDYPPDTKSCSTFHYSNASMLPFPLRNSDGLSTVYTESFYAFEDRPMCSPEKLECGSPYLFCDRRIWRCLSKIRIGGNCTGFENLDSELCFDGRCANGTCQVTGGAGRSSGGQPAPSVAVIAPSPGGQVPESPGSLPTGPTPPPPGPSIALVSPPGPPAPIPSIATFPPLPATITYLITDAQSTCKPCDCLPGPPAPDLGAFATSQPFPPQLPQVTELPPQVDARSAGFDELSDQYVWFTITVLKGRLGDPIKEKVRDGRVLVRGLSYNGTFEGRVSERSDYPYYTGVTFVRVPNPRYQPNFRIEAQVWVYGSTRDNDSGPLHRCTPHCRYDTFPCTGKVVFDSNSAPSSDAMDSILTYSTAPTEVLYRMWKNQEHQTDFFVFLCDPTQDPDALQSDFIPRHPSNRDDCFFQRFENFLLIGHAEIVEHNTSLAECKAICRRTTQEALNRSVDVNNSTICNSLMHWPHDGQCIITSQSRLSQPHLFAHYPKEGVFYFDLICDAKEVFER